MPLRNIALFCMINCLHFAIAAPVDELRLGKNEGYPVGTRLNHSQDKYRVGSYTSWEKLHWTGLVKAAGTPSPLNTKIDPAFDWTYQSKDGQTYGYKGYLERNQTSGVIVLRNQTVAREDYQYDRGPRDRFISMSMGKTLTALATGAAVADGSIRSIDDTVQTYIPAVSGLPYGSRTIRSLLQMSSGMHQKSNDQTGGGTVIRLGGDELPAATPAGALGLAKNSAYSKEFAKQNTVFVYANGDSQMLGYVVAAATGKPLHEFFSEKIWKPLGAEDSATWGVDMGREVRGDGNFSARLRDWARLGGMLANNGAWNGVQILPESWIMEMTTTKKAYSFLNPGAEAYLGYGYQTWLFPGKRRFALLGINGQGIFVDPESKTVLIMTGVWDQEVDPTLKGPDRVAFWVSLINKVSRW